MRLPTISTFRTIVAVAAAWLPAAAVLGELPLPAGEPFRVNTHTLTTKRFSAAAMDADGDFVVVWNSYQQDDPSLEGIFGQRFDRSGQRIGAEFLVNTYTPNIQTTPSIAMTDDGRFVVVWSSYRDGDQFGVFAGRFAATGAPQGAELQVNAHTLDLQAQSGRAVAMRDTGEFVVVWTSIGQDGSDAGVFARRFDSSGAPLATELQVNSRTSGTQGPGAVGIAADGTFVVAWPDESGDGDGYGIFARRFDSSGMPVADEFQVNTYTPFSQERVALAMNDDGAFVVAWETMTGGDVSARRFDSSGAPQGSDIPINTEDVVSPTRPVVAIDAEGGFAVAWSKNQMPSGVMARSFDADGLEDGAAFRVNPPDEYGTDPALGMDDRGDFVVSWTATFPSPGIFARRFVSVPTAILDVDGDGSAEALTDGILVLRFAFGLSGDALVGGALGAGCTRCDATEVSDYLTGLGTMLDADGNGSVTALTDGLLILRYLFGLRDAALASGAVSQQCTRCTGDAVEGFLEPKV